MTHTNNNTTSALAETVSTSTSPESIKAAWDRAVELFEEDQESPREHMDTDEELTIALTNWVSNPHTPEEVIQGFWDNGELREIVEGIWSEFEEEVYHLPHTPEDIRTEIYEED